MEVIFNIIETAKDWLPAITGLVTACAAIAALTPTKVDDKVIQKILNVINFVGLNILKAKNKE